MSMQERIDAFKRGYKKQIAGGRRYKIPSSISRTPSGKFIRDKIYFVFIRDLLAERVNIDPETKIRIKNLLTCDFKKQFDSIVSEYQSLSKKDKQNLILGLNLMFDKVRSLSRQQLSLVSGDDILTNTIDQICTRLELAKYILGG